MYPRALQRHAEAPRELGWTVGSRSEAKVEWLMVPGEMAEAG